MTVDLRAVNLEAPRLERTHGFYEANLGMRLSPEMLEEYGRFAFYNYLSRDNSVNDAQAATGLVRVTSVMPFMYPRRVGSEILDMFVLEGTPTPSRQIEGRERLLHIDNDGFSRMTRNGGFVLGYLVLPETLRNV